MSKAYQPMIAGCAIVFASFCAPPGAKGAEQYAPQKGFPTEEQLDSRITLTPYQLFELAEAADRNGDLTRAETFLRTLTANKDLDLRNEARFRLAMLLAYKMKRLRDAASLLRQILDDRPKTARVRIELAKLDVLLGRATSAQIELRAAQASGLPPEVARDVRFFMQALEAKRRFGISIEGTLMPDSNANRATTSAIINTQLGAISLSTDARERSGLGANLRGQTYAKLAVAKRLNLLAQLSGSATVYRANAFDDFGVSPLIGPEILRKDDRVTVLAGPSFRWFSTKPYTRGLTTALAWQHTLGPRAQLRVDASFNNMKNWRNSSESGQVFGLSAGVDRALTAAAGIGVQVSFFRQDAALSAYSLAGGGISAYAFREMGHATVTVSGAYSKLEADERLILFTRRRNDNALNMSVSVNFRRVRLANLSPLVRVRYEKNFSAVPLYGYRRLAGEFGLSASF